MSDLFLKNARIISNSNSIGNGWIRVINGRIKEISDQPLVIKESETKVIDCQGKTVIPSFIDIHCHGGYGYSFMDKALSLETILEKYSLAVLKEGVTNYCVGTVSATKDELDHFCTQLQKYKNSNSKQENAQVLGAYLEGSFINQLYKGAHDKNVLTTPKYDWISDWQRLSDNQIKIIAYAPELDMDFSEFLIKQNIIPSFAHSAATYEEAKIAIQKGVKNVTHFYNAMAPFNHRNPGPIPAILFDNEVNIELICDGIHVDENIIKLTCDIKGPDKIIAVTDSVEAKGLSDGNYYLGSLPIVKKANKVTLLNSETIAGSASTMLDNFKMLLKITNNNWVSAIKMTSLNAAKLLKIDDLGDIKINYLADLLILDNNNDIAMTIKNGKVVYQKKGSD